MGEELTDSLGARYSHFEAILDCDSCNDEIRIEGDVANGDIIECPVCGESVEVYGR